MQVVLNAAPSRDELFKVLSEDKQPQNLPPGEVYTLRAPSSKEEVDGKMKPWLVSLSELQGRIANFYESQGLEKLFP